MESTPEASYGLKTNGSCPQKYISPALSDLISVLAAAPMAAIPTARDKVVRNITAVD